MKKSINAELLQNIAPTAVNQLRAVIAVLNVDGIVMDCNDAALALWGCERQEVLGKPLQNVLGPAVSVRSAVARCAAGEAVRCSLDAGAGASHPGSHRILDCALSPLTDDSGDIALLLLEGHETPEPRASGPRELDEAHAQFQAMWDQGLFAARLDLNGTVTEANRSFVEGCGFRREDILGRPFWECGWWNREREVQDWIRSAVKQAGAGNPFRGESRFWTADGIERVVDFSCIPIKDSSGRVLFLMPTGMDVTERSSTLVEALPARDEITRALESITDAFVALDRNWHVTYVNAEAERLTGLSRDQMIGRSCWDVFPAPESSPERRELLRAAADRTTVEFETHDAQGNRWFHVRAYPASDGGGISVIRTDITARKQTEFALRESEGRFRAIVDDFPECVKVVAADGSILLMNPAGLSAIRAPGPEKIIGTSVYDLIAPEFREAYREFNERVCRGEKAGLEFDVLVGAERRHLHTRAAPMRTSDGKTVQLGITHDVTDRKRSDTAMLLLGAIVDSSDDAIVSKDLNGIITSWNRGAERLFGYAAEEVIGQPITILIPADRQSEEPEILSRLRRGERVDHFETIRRRKDGALLNISLTISPVRDARGNIVGASKIARDITEGKRSEEAIRKLNAQLTAELSAMTRMQKLSTRLVQADNVPLLLGEIVEAGIEILGANMGSIQLLEDGRLQVVVSRGFGDTPPAFLDTVPDQVTVCGTAVQSGERVIVENILDSALLAGTPAKEIMLGAGIRAVQSTPLVSRSGQVLGAFSTHWSSPHRPEERELRMLDVLARQAADLLERKRAEAALLESERRFRQLADSMPMMVWTARPDGFVDYFNERWYDFTGFDHTRFGDSAWQSILHPEDVRRCRELWYNCVRTGEPYRIEYRFWDRHEYRWRWFMGRALPARNDEGRIVKWFGASTDIDEQKRVEDELRRANHDLEQFAYSSSHDLQEPLRGINIYSQLLTRRYQDRLDGQALQFLEYLRASASRMELLVRDLLAYTQVTKLDLPQQKVDAGQALMDTLANLRGAIMESGATVTFDSLPVVSVHDTHLKQLFQNLVGNAIKYRSPDRPPLIHVSAEQIGEFWLFSVSDNGIGVEPEYRQRIFGVFKRLHTGDRYSGTGIGLAICQRIVERYSGKIWVESEPGTGSRFLFTLPA